MQMNPSIILSGAQPDFVNILRQSNAAAAEANAMQDRNALRQVYQQHGAGIMAGDRNALNALAQYDPGAALDVQTTLAGQRRADTQLGIDQSNLDMREQEFQFKVKEYAASLSASERAAQAEAISNGLKRGIAHYQSGDLQGVNAILQEAGEQPIISLDQFPAVAARYQGVLETMQAVKDFNTGTKPDYAVADGQYYDKNNPQAGAQPIPGYQATTKDSAAEQKINRIVTEYGVDRRTAVGIVDGVLSVSRHPLDGSVVVTDLANNRIVTPEGQ